MLEIVRTRQTPAHILDLICGTLADKVGCHPFRGIISHVLTESDFALLCSYFTSIFVTASISYNVS